jgi:hypothetical protein
MLAHEQGLEASRFKSARQLADLDAVVGRKMENANPHGNSSAG